MNFSISALVSCIAQKKYNVAKVPIICDNSNYKKLSNDIYLTAQYILLKCGHNISLGKG